MTGLQSDMAALEKRIAIALTRQAKAVQPGAQIFLLGAEFTNVYPGYRDSTLAGAGTTS